MSSWFESQVYQLQNKIPFTSPDLLRFMKVMAYNTQTYSIGRGKLKEPIENPDIQLSVCYRKDVNSGMWWMLKWVDVDGKEHSVRSQYLDKLGYRAIQLHLNIKDKMETEKGKEKAKELPIKEFEKQLNKLLNKPVSKDELRQAIRIWNSGYYQTVKELAAYQYGMQETTDEYYLKYKDELHK